MIKKSVLIISILLTSICLYSQQGMLGLFAGGSTYNGELNQRNPIYQPGHAIGIVYQHLFSDRFIMRIQTNYSILRGIDATSNNEYQRWRNYSFATNIWDIGVMSEINFLKFNTNDFSKNYYTPYLLCGAKLLVVPDAITSFEFSVPVGFGFKYLLTKKVIVGIEWVAHYSNSDELDVLQPDIYTQKQRSYNPNSDWYHYYGIVLTFNLFKEKNGCPGMKY